MLRTRPLGLAGWLITGRQHAPVLPPWERRIGLRAWGCPYGGSVPQPRRCLCDRRGSCAAQCKAECLRFPHGLGADNSMLRGQRGFLSGAAPDFAPSTGGLLVARELRPRLTNSDSET